MPNTSPEARKPGLPEGSPYKGESVSYRLSEWPFVPVELTKEEMSAPWNSSMRETADEGAGSIVIRGIPRCRNASLPDGASSSRRHAVDRGRRSGGGKVLPGVRSDDGDRFRGLPMSEARITRNPAREGFPDSIRRAGNGRPSRAARGPP